MTTVIKRGKTFHFQDTVGGKRLRLSLGVNARDAASSLSRQIGSALVEGQKSDKWTLLKRVLPPASFRTLTDGMTFAASSNLGDFQTRWEDHLDRRVKLGELTESSRRTYRSITRTFFDRMAELGVQKMDNITPIVIEEYLVWRKDSIVAKRGPDAGRGLVPECAVLASIFDLAREEGVLQSSPLRHRYRPTTEAQGAKPFTPEELALLEAAATGEFRLPFLLFRWTGMRCSDVCSVTWGAWRWDHKAITWKTKKRGTTVTIPITEDFNNKLDEHYQIHKPDLSDPILFGLSEAKLYALVKKLGDLAGVKDVHPHRFRASLATEMLSKGASLWDVAKLLGDTTRTVEKHYAHVVDGQQDRVRGILENL